ncbi:glucose 1-dehydrogenase [Pseudomonadales bacterium]|jgi:3(or 17)beta-hydroxysteroid dehydrogenase|nr:glucose 1-dehydrogenase [Pseudomonadales bacterium]
MELTKMKEFENKVVLITGGADGIGKGCVMRFAEQGATVIIGDIQSDKGHALADEIGASARFVHLDVTDDQAWQNAVALITREFGALHILVNNAGVSSRTTIEDLDLAGWRAIHAVNLDAIFLGSHHAIPLIHASGGGSIVTISSALGIKPFASYPAYCSAKAAARMLTKTLALYCAERGYGIRCNTVFPGAIKTPLSEKLAQDSGDYDAYLKFRSDSHPIGFIGDPIDVANAVSFLSSDQARYITGADLAVDGGASL